MRILNHFQQGSQEWLALRATKITMSRAKDLLTKGNGVTRASYLREVAASIVGGVEMDRFESRDMMRGHEMEPFALRAAEAYLSESFQTPGFVLFDDERIGCSPDGLSEGWGIEIKAPRALNHLRYLGREQVERDHGAQIQGNMWVCGRSLWHFISFCPDVPQRPLIHHVFERNEATCNAIENSAMAGADEVEAIVEMVRAAILPGEVHRIANHARQHWQALQAELSGEVKL